MDGSQDGKDKDKVDELFGNFQLNKPYRPSSYNAESSTNEGEDPLKSNVATKSTTENNSKLQDPELEVGKSENEKRKVLLLDRLHVSEIPSSVMNNLAGTSTRAPTSTSPSPANSLNRGLLLSHGESPSDNVNNNFARKRDGDANGESWRNSDDGQVKNRGGRGNRSAGGTNRGNGNARGLRGQTGERTDSYGGRKNYTAGYSKQEDWICPNKSCAKVNFSRRTECFACGILRPGNSSGNMERGESNGIGRMHRSEGERGRGARGGNRGAARGNPKRGGKAPSPKETSWESLFSDDASTGSERNITKAHPSNDQSPMGNGIENSAVGISEPSLNDNETRTEACGTANESPEDEEDLLLMEMMNSYKQKTLQEIHMRRNETSEGQLQRRLDTMYREHKQNLPIFQQRKEILKAVKDNQVVIVTGETGSGKSTQLPQYLVSAGFAARGKIGITQPRRIAATSLAERVADELGVMLGDDVGYAVRFDKKVSDKTVIKYMTDGFLFKECTNDPDFNSYSVIIIDEAHERSIHTDVILGLAKRAIKRRDDLKVIVSSATLDFQKLMEFFDQAPILRIQGKPYDVEVIHEPEEEEVGNDKMPSNKDYLKRVIEIVRRIHRTEDSGDVLVFLPGKEEIESVKAELGNESKCIIKSCHSNLPLHEQREIYDEPPEGHRKIVLATNIAETSITIDGIVYVVDCGYFKESTFDPVTKMSSLVEQRITKFHALQRQGRAGRTCPGKCFRVYTQSEFNDFKPAPVPDIARLNLESVVLDLFKLGIKNPMKFDFMDKPPRDPLCEALYHLVELSALSVQEKAVFHLTDEGMRMADFPIEPTLAKAIIQSLRLNCPVEVSIIVAMLSAFQHRQVISSSDPRCQNEVVAAKRKFDHLDGDHLTLMNIYMRWEKVPDSQRQEWCRTHFIENRNMVEAKSIKNQLLEILKRSASNGANRALPELTMRAGDPIRLSEDIRKAFTAGFFRQIAMKTFKQHAYEPVMAKALLLKDKPIYLHSLSSLMQRRPEPTLVIFHEVSKNKDQRAYMRHVFEIEGPWIKECARTYYEKLQALREESARDFSEQDA